MDDPFFPEGSIWEKRTPLTKQRKIRIRPQPPKLEANVPQCLCLAQHFNPDCPIATESQKIAHWIELEKEETAKKLYEKRNSYNRS